MLICYSDDEYRLLRQNLFERFATSTAVPTEASVVPVLRPQLSGMSLTSDGKRQEFNLLSWLRLN